MQFEELQARWNLLDQKLERSLALQTEIARQALVQPARRRILRHAVWPAFDVAFCAVVLLWNGSFLANHWRDARFAAPSIALAIGALTLAVDSIRQLERIARLDWGGPVAAIQRSLESLRVAKVRQFMWIMLLAPLMGWFGLVVGGQALLEHFFGNKVNLYDKLDSWWIAGNYLFGVLFIPIGYYAARALAKRFPGRSWRQAMIDGIAGNSLKAALEDVARWASLERGSSGGDSQTE